MTGSGTTTLPPGELYPFLLKFLGTDLENLGVGFPGAWVSLTVVLHLIFTVAMLPGAYQ